MKKIILIGWSFFSSFSLAGVVAHYPFDADYADLSGNGHDGTLNDSGVMGDSGISTTAGEFVFGGGAINLSEERDFVEVPNQTFGTGSPYTIAFWARKAAGDTGDPANWDMVIGERGNTNFFIALNDASGEGGRLGYRWRSIPSAGGNRQGDYVSTEDSEWHHYALSASADGTHVFYFDGVATETMAGVATGFIIDTIGEAYSDARDFDFHGQLDEVWIFDEELPATGVEGLFRSNNHLATGAGIEAESIVLNDNGEVNITFSGLTVGKEYRLVRGTDLETFAIEIEDRAAASGTEVFSDLEPLLGGAAFYRLEEVAAP